MKFCPEETPLPIKMTLIALKQTINNYGLFILFYCCCCDYETHCILGKLWAK
jgi:hypothetical protein